MDSGDDCLRAGSARGLSIRVGSDLAACFTALFVPQAEPPLSQADLLRKYVGHDSVTGFRRLIVSFLVHPEVGTRRVLRELTAIGDLGAGSRGEAVFDTAVAAAARRATK